MTEKVLKPFQDRFIFSPHRFPALVSAIGTGKTMCGISRMVTLMDRYPNNLGIVVRKEFTDLKDSTIKDFTLYTGIDVPSSKDVILPNGSVIMFRHGDEINVLKNINAGAILIEQAEEFDTDETFIFLRDRLRRKEAVIRTLFIIANCNGHNWIWKHWKINAAHDPEFHLEEATTFDNADNLPADYIADLQKMEHTHPEHYRRYVLNSWEDEDTVDLIIRPEWVRKAIARDLSFGRYVKQVVVCDVARFGDDETVIYAIRNNELIDESLYTAKSTMETAGHIIKMANKHGMKDIAVDVIGVGSGVVDRLRELGWNVIALNSAEQANSTEKYRNKRAEMWAVAADLFESDNVSIPADDMLIEQLTHVKYKTIESNGKLQVESKEDVKKRIGKSPDRADALVMGLYAISMVSPVYKDKYFSDRKAHRVDINPMTV